MASRVFANLLMLWGVAARPSALFRPHRDVVTTQGAVRGYMVGGNPPHFAYFGVPYGRPPTRHDRFKAPEPPPPWDGIFEATHRIRCPQPGAAGDENCLVVNVFAPTHASSLPVMVFVHGGAFQSGWGAHHPPLRLLSDGFVVTTFNYRIGALGFLCLRTPEAPGNAGLKDQAAALYWVNRNIASFGGNPRDVTVYGVGAGAASVHFLLLSGLAKGLLHKVILESGSALSPMSMNYEVLSTAFDGANLIGYEGTDDRGDLLEFYQNVPTKELIQIPTMFLPCVENESHYSHSLLDADPVRIMKQGVYHKVPMMLVYTDREDTTISSKEIEKIEKVPENFDYLLPNNLEFDNMQLKHKVGDIVKEFYFGDEYTRVNIVEDYAHYINDIFIEYPLVKFAMLYAAKSPHYVYIMKTTLQRVVVSTGDTSIQKVGTIMDYFYKTDLESEDAEIIEKFMVLFSNFIKISDPTPLTTTLIPVIWQPVPADRDENTDISDVPILLFPTLKMSPPPSHQQLTFLDNIYNRFYKPHVLDVSDDGLDDNN